MSNPFYNIVDVWMMFSDVLFLKNIFYSGNEGTRATLHEHCRKYGKMHLLMQAFNNFLDCKPITNKNSL